MKALFILSVLCIPLGVFGQYKSGETVSISQPHEDDLYLAGGTIIISAPIGGDLIAAGGNISIYDSIAQDLVVAGGNISVKGVIGDDVRCAGGTIDIEGDVLDDVIIFGGEVTIDRDAHVYGDLTVFGGQVNVLGNISGNIKAYGGQVDIGGDVGQNIDIRSEKFTLRGKVNGSAKIASERLHIDPEARISGDLNYWTDEGEIDVSESNVAGTVIYDESLELERSSFDWRIGGAAFFLMSIAYMFASFLIILVFHLIFGRQFQKAATSFQTDIGRSLGYGMIYIIGVPIVIALLMAIIIGIPIALFLLVLYIFSFLFGLPIASLMLVNFFNESQDFKWNKAMIVFMTLVTLIVIRFITIIPFVGWLIGLLIIGSTYGAFIQTWIQARKETSLEEISNS